MKNKYKVYESYEKIANWFDEVRMRDLSFEKNYIDIVIARIKPKSSILDLGCGMGEPIAKYLVEKDFKVTGIDGSHNMINKAKKYVPEAEFYAQDMRKINLQKKFDAIIMWNSFFHLPTEDQVLMFKTLEKHIKPGGILLFTSGDKRGEIWSDNGGEDLYHASLSIAEYNELLKKHSFEIILNKVKDIECGDITLWLAKYKNSNKLRIN